MITRESIKDALTAKHSPPKTTRASQNVNVNATFASDKTACS